MKKEYIKRNIEKQMEEENRRTEEVRKNERRNIETNLNIRHYN
jgi:hypothetical protein